MVTQTPEVRKMLPLEVVKGDDESVQEVETHKNLCLCMNLNLLLKNLF